MGGPSKASKYAKKLELFTRFNFTCHYCNTKFPTDHPIGEMLTYKENGNHLTADHIVLKSLGGRSYPSNLVAACYECNNLRGDMEYDQFRQMMEKKSGRTIFSAVPIFTYPRFTYQVRNKIKTKRQSICDVVFSDRHTSTSDN